MSENKSSSQVKPTDFVERNNLKGILAIARDWIAILLIIAFSIWADNIIVYFISIWLIAAFQLALGESLVHEAIHLNLFANKSWNEKLQFLYAYPFLRTIYSYKEHHFDHHKDLWGKKDYIAENYEFLGLNKPKKSLFFILIVQPLLGLSAIYFFVEILYNFNPQKLKNDKKLLISTIQMVLFWLIVIPVFYFSGYFHLLVLYWFVPLFWCYSGYSLFSEVEEHFNTLSGTRSNIDSFFNLLFHNGGYHYVHHICPTIPWYKLPEAHKALSVNYPNILLDISNNVWETYQQFKRDNSEKQVIEKIDKLDELRVGYLPLTN